MIRLYHGSPCAFDTFQIDASLVRHSTDTLAEGIGIYFTEHQDFAASYGEYVYEVDIEETAITDFTDAKTISALLERMSKRLGFSLTQWLDVPSFVRSVQSGLIAVATLYREIQLLLDSQEGFYEACDNPDTLLDAIEVVFSEEITDVLKYYDPSFAQSIYICIRHPEKLPIKNR